MNQIALVMPVFNEADAVLDSLKTVAGSGVGKLFDLLIIQEQGERNLSLLDFDLKVHNQHTLGRVQITDVSLGQAFDRGRMLNHVIKLDRHPLLIPIYPGMLLTQRFLISALNFWANGQERLKKSLVLAPCLSTGKENRVPRAWPQGISRPGQLAGMTPLLLKAQVETVHGYDENTAVSDKDGDLVDRLAQCFKLEVCDLVQERIVNLLPSEVLSPCQVNEIMVQLTSRGKCSEPAAPGASLRNPTGWGEILAEYESGY
jgi:hypothetical protein